MMLTNKEGQKVYYNLVIKHDKVRYMIAAASGQIIRGRDGQKLKSRTFAQQHQAEAWLARNGTRQIESAQTRQSPHRISGGGNLFAVGKNRKRRGRGNIRHQGKRIRQGQAQRKRPHGIPDMAEGG